MNAAPRYSAWHLCNRQGVSAATLISRVTAQHPVRDLFVENPPIEEIIARLYAAQAD